MKVRSGFVSNSSSSSFVCWTTRDLGIQALQELEREEAELVERHILRETLAGVKVWGYSESSDMSGFRYVNGEEVDSEVTEALDAWRTEVSELCHDALLETSEDM